MRKIIFGNLKKNKNFRKKLRASYRQATRVLYPIFGKKQGYDLIFARVTWTYSTDGIDFYRRQNHASLNIDERKIVRILDLTNAIIRAITSEELRKKDFKNEFLQDILAVGAGFYLAKKRKDLHISPKIQQKLLGYTEDIADYNFDYFMDGDDDLPEDFLGYFGEKIIAQIVLRGKSLKAITEADIAREIRQSLAK